MKKIALLVFLSPALLFSQASFEEDCCNKELSSMPHHMNSMPKPISNKNRPPRHMKFLNDELMVDMKFEDRAMEDRMRDLQRMYRDEMREIKRLIEDQEDKIEHLLKQKDDVSSNDIKSLINRIYDLHKKEYELKKTHHLAMMREMNRYYMSLDKKMDQKIKELEANSEQIVNEF
ncbi:MAG: hypothetical protein ACRCS8_06030 [Brevinema sp.]